MNNTAKMMTALDQAGITTKEFERANLKVQEVGETSIIRIHSLDKDQISSDMRQLNIDLPASVGQSHGSDPVMLCIRPGEWLLLTTSLTSGDWLEKLQAAGQTETSVIFDASDAMATIRLSGAAAPWLLAKLSGLDFVGGSGAGQHCARTKMGAVAVVVSYRQVDDESSEYVYDLIFDRSVALYVWDLLQHSADHAEELLG